MEHLIHKSLEHRRGTEQAVQHDLIFIVARNGHKSGLLFVPISDTDQVVGTVQGKLAEKGCSKGKREESIRT